MNRQQLPALLALVVLLVVWQAACSLFAIPDYILPAPTQIYAAIVDVGGARWLENLWVTLRICLLGFGAAIVISLPLAALMTASSWLRNALYPLLVVIQSTPIVAIAPLLIVTLGTGDLPRVVITFLITFFPIVVSATTGMLNTPEELIELSRTIGAPRYREFTQIRLPHSIPYIFSGLRIAITLAIVGTVVAEFVAAENGLGYFIQFSTSFFAIPNAFAGLVILLCLSLALFFTVTVLQKLLFPWSLPEEK
ncbi:ABC transporter permease [Halioxenophilus sp. WMMB6]|uniref:ABC transporter permease n=1 Tax=Halioxenophilus sp. WMMB6 TaxID=3073815 RepID=UPI00295F1074|nr:ABC transporter permease [Halioxenophilus sp. WMMB6]